MKDQDNIRKSWIEMLEKISSNVNLAEKKNLQILKGWKKYFPVKEYLTDSTSTPFPGNILALKHLNIAEIKTFKRQE